MALSKQPKLSKSKASVAAHTSSKPVAKPSSTKPKPPTPTPTSATNTKTASPAKADIKGPIAAERTSIGEKYMLPGVGFPVTRIAHSGKGLLLFAVKLKLPSGRIEQREYFVHPSTMVAFPRGG